MKICINYDIFQQHYKQKYDVFINVISNDPLVWYVYPKNHINDEWIYNNLGLVSIENFVHEEENGKDQFLYVKLKSEVIE